MHDSGYYHFGKGHSDLARYTAGLPKLTFQNCHFTVKRCAIKLEITLVGTQAVKCFTARPENPIISPFLEFHEDDKSWADRDKGYIIF